MSSPDQYTIIHNSGGYHGHQLKDYFGGQTVGKLLGLEYLHSPYPYLSFFGLGYKEKLLPVWKRYLSFYRKKSISGPYWDGIESFQDFQELIATPINQHPNSLIVLDHALRVHPHQTIKWYKDKLIKRNIFNEIVKETTQKFRSKHQVQKQERRSGPIKVAMHISRGVDFDKKRFPEHFEASFNVRYMFDIEYFLNIYFQIKKKYGSDFEIDIYTEELNSSDIVKVFEDRKEVKIHIGKNRAVGDIASIEKIFMDFAKADILVSCNSSFSTEAIFFRDGLTTIYHPHMHLNGLEDDWYLATDIEGNFDHSFLP